MVITKVPMVPKARVERAAGLFPVLRGSIRSSHEVRDRTLAAVARRRHVLTSHRDAGREHFQNLARLQATRNCPPCGVFVRPFLAFCQFRDCPFCHGRAVSEDFTGFAAALDCWAAAGRPLRAVVVTQDFETEPGRAATVLRQVAAGAAAFLDQKGVVGSLYRLSFGPSADGAVVHVRMAAAALLTPLARLKTNRAVPVLDRPSPPRGVSIKAFGSAFVYQPGWLDAPAGVAVDLLVETSGVRVTGRTGALKPMVVAANPFLTSDGRRAAAEPVADAADGGGV